MNLDYQYLSSELGALESVYALIPQGNGPDCIFKLNSNSLGPIYALGRVVRKPVGVNPGLKVNPSIYFSCIKIFFTAYVLC